MSKLTIHESLIPYIRKLTNKNELNIADFNDKNIIDKVNAAYKDAIKLYPTIKMFKFITYNIIKPFYGLKPLTKETIFEMLDKLFEDKKFINRISSSNPESEFFSVIKDIMPYYLEFQKYINNNDGYNAVILYEQIVKYLNNETLDNKKEDELQAECLKRYNFPFNDVDTYRLRMLSKTYKKQSNYDIEKLYDKGFYSYTCYLLSVYFHEKMLNFYKKSGYIYTRFNDEYAFFKFKNIGILTYVHDDSVRLSINGFDSSRYEFWALLFKNSYAKINVDLEMMWSINFKGDLLVAPRDFMEEAVIKYLMGKTGETSFTDNFMTILNKVGIPNIYCTLNELSSNDNKVFFVNPRKFDRLNMNNIEKFPTLKRLLEKDEEEKDQYIKKIIATYNGKHKIDDYEETAYERRKKNPKAWID